MPKQSANVAIFARLASRPIPRMSRMMLVARDMGYSPLYVGAMRDKDVPREDFWEGWPVVRVGPEFPLLNGRRPGLYVASVIRVWYALLRKVLSVRPALMHVSDFELYWPCRVYSWLFRVPFIYNIHDNLAQRYRVPRWVAARLNFVEGVAALTADVTLVPEGFRRDALPLWCRKRVRVVRNSPVDPGVRAPSPAAGAGVRLLFAGWLDKGRGLEDLLDLAQDWQECDLVLAGEGDEEVVERAQGLSNVMFLGFLTHQEVIAQTEACHFVVALYDPGRPINRYAASNKIAEALAVGRPVILNKELEIAKMLSSRGCAVLVDYERVGDLKPMLTSLMSRQEEYVAMCQRARAAYESEYAWDRVYRQSESAIRFAIGGKTPR